MLIDPDEFYVLIDKIPYTASYSPIQELDLAFKKDYDVNTLEISLVYKIYDDGTMLVGKPGGVMSVPINDWQRLTMTQFHLN